MRSSILYPLSSILYPLSSILFRDPGAGKQIAGPFQNQVFGWIGRVAGPILMNLISRVLPAQDDLVAAAIVQDEVVAFSITVPVSPGLILWRHQISVIPASAMYAQDLARFEGGDVIADPIKLQLARGVAIIVEKRVAELHRLEVNHLVADVLHVHPFAEKRLRTSRFENVLILATLFASRIRLGLNNLKAHHSGSPFRFDRKTNEAV